MTDSAAAGRTSESEIRHEQDLVARSPSDPDAFAALYDLYVGRLYRYAYRHLGSHADAEDLTSQVFQRALEALPRYEPRGVPFGGWLFRIAHNLLVDRFRAASPALSLDGVDPPRVDSTGRADDLDASLTTREDLDTAWAAVDTLPALQRRAVVLRFGRNLSHAEIGPLIGRSEAATKQLIYRAMKTLRRRLQSGEGQC